MRILIIALPRTGSSNLLKGIAEGNFLNESEVYYEPFHLSKTNQDLVYTTNTLVKTLIEQTTNEFLLQYKEKFDKVILLSRKNLFKATESLAYSFQSEDFHKPYEFSSKDIDKKWIKYSKNYIKKAYTQLLKFSSLTKIPITYYEDLYSGDKEFVKNFLKVYNIQVQNFDVMYECLNPKNKYRKN